MAFTEIEEAAVRGILAAVGGAGLNADSLAKTLRIGKLTTEISELEAKVANKVAEKDAAAQAFDVEISDLRNQMDAIRQQLRAATGNA